MKITVTGSLGNIGNFLVRDLIKKNHQVKVVTSNPEKQKEIQSIGASAAVGSVLDIEFLTSAFLDSDAIYTMVPPNYSAPNSRGYYNEIGDAYLASIKKSGVTRVVNLSSWGADLNQGTGFILGSHDIENKLNSLSKVSVTHLRAGFIYYNIYNFSDMIRTAGMIGANYGSNDKIAMVAPSDIAAAAAEELISNENGKKVRYVVSDDLTANHAARIIGAAIGKPELQWITFTDEQATDAMTKLRLPPDTIHNSIELGSAIHSGRIRKHYDSLNPVQFGKVKFEEFAKEFATNYKK